MWGKEVSATLIRKETKKEEKKHNFTCVPANEAMAVAGLVGLRGEARWRGGGFENLACGEKEVSAMVRKEMKKKKKT